MSKKKTKQDQIIDLLGALCEKIDKLIVAVQAKGHGLAPDILPPPADPPQSYPTIMLYGCIPPGGTGQPYPKKPWIGSDPYGPTITGGQQ